MNLILATDYLPALFESCSQRSQSALLSFILSFFLAQNRPQILQVCSSFALLLVSFACSFILLLPAEALVLCLCVV